MMHNGEVTRNSIPSIITTTFSEFIVRIDRFISVFVLCSAELGLEVFWKYFVLRSFEKLL